MLAQLTQSTDHPSAGGIKSEGVAMLFRLLQLAWLGSSILITLATRLLSELSTCPSSPPEHQKELLRKGQMENQHARGIQHLCPSARMCIGVYDKDSIKACTKALVKISNSLPSKYSEMRS